MIFVIIFFFAWVIFLVFMNILIAKAKHLIKGVSFDASKEFPEVIQKIEALHDKDIPTYPPIPSQVSVKAWVLELFVVSLLRKQTVSTPLIDKFKALDWKISLLSSDYSPFKKVADYNIRFSLLPKQNFSATKDIALNCKFFFNPTLLDRTKEEFLAEMKVVLQKEMANIYTLSELMDYLNIEE